MKNNRPVLALIVILLATTVYFGYKGRRTRLPTSATNFFTSA